MEATCTRCGGAFELEDRVMRRDECPHCHEDLHSCKQCAFYEPGHHNDCREPQAELIADKDTANFCEWFKFSGSYTQTAEKQKVDEAKAALEALFKK